MLSAVTDVAKYVSTYAYGAFYIREKLVRSIQMIKTITLFSFSRIVSHSIVYITLLCCTGVTVCYKVNIAFLNLWQLLGLL